MEILAKRLKERARQLDLSDAEVARRSNLAERRYGHYVRGSREPDFQTLLRICRVMGVTPNDLLLNENPVSKSSAQDRWVARLLSVAKQLEVDDVKLAVRQVEILLDHRKKQSR